MSRRNRKRGNIKSFPLGKLFPNVITILGLCAGLFAIKFSMLEKWQMSVGLIVVAAFMDNIDGRLARMFDASSDFGAQLDSLADFLSFSVAPALILYSWITHEAKGIGWVITLFFIICGAVRLARFNVRYSKEGFDPKIEIYFFKGIAAPPAALLSLVPMMLVFVFNERVGEGSLQFSAIEVVIFQVIVAVFMVSRIPTFSLKKINIGREFVPMLLAVVGLILVLFIVEPWIVLPVIGSIYLATVPFSVWLYHRMTKNSLANNQQNKKE